MPAPRQHADHEHDHDHPHPHPATQAGHEHDHGDHDHSDHDHGDHDHGNHSHADHDHHDDHHHDHHQSGLWGWLSAIFHLHGHSHQHSALATDNAFVANEEGIRTVWIALAALTVTSLIQIFIFWLSGSVALFADTLHNIGDGLNSIPLLIAFYLTRRAATRRYTYGFGRAEDVAGIFIVLSIAISAAIIFWESFQKLIGSAALVADGMHARTDGLTSLAVLIAVAGSWLGYPLVDPIVGIVIGVTILFITWDATKTMWYRLMDAIEPEHLQRVEEVIRQQSGIKEVNWLRMRWFGHRIHADIGIAEIMVHVDPWSTQPEEHHALTAHHETTQQQTAQQTVQQQTA
jgi:divalent metal cation (Fe/Co/Zn/Cd) transporter